MVQRQNEWFVCVYYCLEEANVLSEGSDATAESDEEHDHPHHNQDDGWVDQERVPHCVWEKDMNTTAYVETSLLFYSYFS